MPAGPVYIVQSLAITGEYVPLYGEYHEYDTMEDAIDHAIPAWRSGNRVRIVEGTTGNEVATLTPWGLSESPPADYRGI